MKEFVLIFRMDILTPEAQPTEQQMAEYMDSWMKWIEIIAEKGQLADGGNHLSKKGKVVRPGKIVSDGPYTDEKNSVAGYIIVLADSLEEAVDLAKKCPILDGDNTSVEVREAASL